MKFNWDGLKYSFSNNIQAEIGYMLIENIGIKEDDKILDVGCGVGNITLKIAEKIKKGEVIGIDSSYSMIEKCIETKKNTELINVNFLTMSALDIDYKNEFDIVFSNSVLHWIKEDEKLLTVFYNALNKCGRIILQFPLLNKKHPLVQISNKVIDKLGLNKYYESWIFPWYVPDLGEYKALLNKLDYKKININKIDSNFNFGSYQSAYDFFDSVGLKLYLEPLFSDDRKLFKDEFIKELQPLEKNEGLSLQFERIIVFAEVNK